MKLDLLFSPLQVGPMTVPNRICETTNTIGAGRLDFLADDVYTEHHVQKARGGVGWIGGEAWILPAPIPDEAPQELTDGGFAIRIPAYYMPGFVERLRSFVDAVHEAGSVAVCQIGHGNVLFGPSAVPLLGSQHFVPHELDDDEMEWIISSFADAAEQLVAAGADAIEVHASHETLPHFFLSPATNRRTDRWGGDTEARTRFVVEILRRVRDRIGDTAAVGVRVSGGEYRPGGYDLLEAQEIAGYIAEGARPDFFSVDVGHLWGDPTYVAPSYAPPALGAAHAKEIRRIVAPIPVLYAGRVFDPLLAEQLLAEGACDLVGMTRASIADPEFPNKAREGRFDEIRACIGCNRCIDNAVHGVGTGLANVMQRAMCSVNPVIGNELLWRASYRPAETRRRVVVVGAGAAGLEAARVAAMRGHEVIVLERSGNIGGQVRLASLAPGRDQFANLPTYYQTQIKLLSIDLRLGVDCDAEAVRALSPDVVICATGSIPLAPEIPGVDGPNVHQAWDVLEGTCSVGHRVVVLSQEDGMETPSVADALASRGHEVEVFHHWAGIAGNVGRYAIATVLRRLEAGGVKTHAYQRAVRIDRDRVELVSSLTGFSSVVEGVDSVVLSCGSRPATDLYRALKGTAPEIHLVGAAWAPRGIHEATEMGMLVGLAL
ncbi:MAG: FAD-dependent oxidoreductase [Acidimicrobiia bacterium]|nr:FAD-dependent oxidoreductase [Acidimicrobiia bacterium]